MDYKFNKDGTWIPAKKEVWCWIAIYFDGTELRQYDDRDSTFHQFKEIDQTKLHLFKMVHETKSPLTLVFNPERMKLIHFYRNTRLNIGTDQEQFLTSYCFGYEVNESGRTVKSMLMLLPNGETVLTEDTGLVNFE
jgi:hypothetical protein